MSLEKICVSFETAKRLVEAGIVLEKSVFSWFFNKNALYSTFPMLKFTNDNRARLSSYPAPTAEEFVLPDKIEYDFHKCKLHCVKQDGEWWVCIELGVTHSPYFHNVKLCESLSEMLLWLKENGHLKGA
jgi:hypothetical protein